jgi:hypothetical protein
MAKRGHEIKSYPLSLGPTRRPSRAEHGPRLARAPTSSKFSASPEPWPRAKSTSRPSPSLRRNQRLARALVSGGINASPEPRSRRQASHARRPYCGRDVNHAPAHAAAGNDPHYSNNSCPCYASPISRRKRCEMLNLRAVGITQQSLFLSAGQGMSLGKDCHDPEQGPIR